MNIDYNCTIYIISIIGFILIAFAVGFLMFIIHKFLKVTRYI